MFKDPSKAEEFICSVLIRTQSNTLKWKENRIGRGFIENSYTVDLFLFDDSQLMLVYRDLSDPCDVVISPSINELHRQSLLSLYQAICRQVGVLF